MVSKQALLDTVEKIQSVSVLVVGDLILDRYIWGSVERISPEAPVPVVDVKRGDDRLGGAGNAARNIRGLGATCQICGFIGDDAEGQALLNIFDRDGIGKDGVLMDRARPTALKTRILCQGQQMIRIDRENRAPHSDHMNEAFAAMVDSQLGSAQVVVLSDYGKGVVSKALMKKFDEARKAQRLGLSVRPLMVDPHPASYGLYQQVCIAKPNRKEAEAATGIKINSLEDADRAALDLLQRWQASVIIITLGEDGLLIRSGASGAPLVIPTVARQVFDVSGAGDTVTAVFAAAVATGASMELAGQLANIAAGYVVSQVGTVAIDREQLIREVQNVAN